MSIRNPAGYTQYQTWQSRLVIYQQHPVSPMAMCVGKIKKKKKLGYIQELHREKGLSLRQDICQCIIYFSLFFLFFFEIKYIYKRDPHII